MCICGLFLFIRVAMCSVRRCVYICHVYIYDGVVCIYMMVSYEYRLVGVYILCFTSVGIYVLHVFRCK